MNNFVSSEVLSPCRAECGDWKDCSESLWIFPQQILQQAGKVYVQDRLRETGSQVWELLQQGGHFYICGDAANMATAVEEALLDIIAQAQVCLCRVLARVDGLHMWQCRHVALKLARRCRRSCRCMMCLKPTEGINM